SRLMPSRRHSSRTFAPASASLTAATFCSSVNLLLRITPPRSVRRSQIISGSGFGGQLSDAPLALGGDATRAAHARGPGAAPAVVVMPAASVSTAQAYASLGDRIGVAGPARIEVAALGSWDALADVACNDFERV